MSIQSLFGTPPAVNAPDNSEDTYAMGTRILFAVAGNIVGIRFWGATFNITTAPAVCVYDTLGVLKGPEEAMVGPFVAAAWNTRMLAAPIAVTAGETLDVTVGPRDRYAANTATFTVPLIVGDLTGLAGRFIVSAVGNPPPFPNNSSTTWYGVDVIFDSGTTVSGILTGTLPALVAAFTGTVVPPAPPAGDGDLTVTVAAYGQLEAAAQRILCWAGDPDQLVITTRTTGLIRMFLPEHAFGVGPLRLKTAGPDVLAGFLPGEHRLIPVGNVDATETDPNTCPIIATPRPNSLTTRVGGNPAAVLLDYTAFAGGVDILWGDGAASLAQPAAATVAHTYPGEGQFTVTIRDTDDFANAAIFDIAVP